MVRGSPAGRKETQGTRGVEETDRGKNIGCFDCLRKDILEGESRGPIPVLGSRLFRQSATDHPSSRGRPACSGAIRPSRAPAAGPGRTTRHPGRPTPFPPTNWPKRKRSIESASCSISVGSLWGLVFLGWLLASRTSSRLEPGCSASTRGAGFRACSSFSSFLSSPHWPACRWTQSDTPSSRHYGISVQGWAGWFGDQAKALGVSLIAVPVLLLFNWIVRRWPRRYWLGAWVATLPSLVVAIVVRAAARTGLQQVRAAPEESCRPGCGNWRKSSPAPEPTFPPIACS